MNRRNNAYILAEEVIALSEAGSWDAAKLEWALEDIYMSEEPDQCLCGHFPIIEICVLKNKANGNFAVVGNCCVKKFMGLRSDKIFDALKRVKKDNTKSLNPEAIEQAFQSGWIKQWDKSFYLDIWRKKELSQKQIAHKVRINNVVLGRILKTR